MNPLSPYSSPLTDSLRRHLLNRTLLGYYKSEYDEYKTMSLDQITTSLLSPAPLPSPPINYNYAEDNNVPIGQSWVNVPLDPDNINKTHQYRIKSLQNWTAQYFLEEKNSIYPKMILFWHNHFVTSEIKDPRFDYDYFKTLHQYALGNFKDLTKAMVVHPSMLRYLNGNQNTAQNPNENFARELLELFTIGKGPLVADGDYTHYTEVDVVAISKCLTGWKDNGYRTSRPGEITSTFRNDKHDKTSKTLSPRLDSIVINNSEAEEYKEVVEILFSKKEVARFICRKLYRYFIDSNIDQNTEADVIKPLGELLYDSQYEIKPVVEVLLKSQILYTKTNIGAIIKNPIEFVIPFIKHSHIYMDPLHRVNRQTPQYLGKLSQGLGMEIFAPPTVSGWKAYYQAPGWYKNWITTTTLKDRHSITLLYLESTTNFETNIGANIIDSIADFDYPDSPRELVRELTLLMLPTELTEDQITALKESFIPGLPDYEWTVEYDQFLKNPSDQDLKKALNAKLKTLILNIVSLPDYQII